MNVEQINSLFFDLFPLQRSLIGNEVDETISKLETNFKFDKSEFPTGSRIFDWTVPNGWCLHSMELSNCAGDTIWSNSHSKLSTVFHSTPIETKLTRAQLLECTFTVPNNDDAVPYRTSYYSQDYGICMPKRLLDTLTEDEYFLKIDSEFYPTSLKVCEYVVPGRSKKEILFCSYVCHPSMANNELSGPVTIVNLIEDLLSRGYSGYYTLRFCLFPETIGALALLKLRGQHLIKNLVAGYVLTCIGDHASLSFKKAFLNKGGINSITTDVLKSHNDSKTKIYEFEPFGSDERQFNSPAFRLPVGTLCRSKFGEFPEYHTDLDDLTLISADKIIDNVAFCRKLIERHNQNLKYKRVIDQGELFLTKYDLYDTVGGAISQSEKSKYLAWFLHLADGETNLYDICEEANLDFMKMSEIAELCVFKRIVKIV